MLLRGYIKVCYLIYLQFYIFYFFFNLHIIHKFVLDPLRKIFWYFEFTTHKMLCCWPQLNRQQIYSYKGKKCS